MSTKKTFELLERINEKPRPYEYYTAEFLWNDPHISKKMLELHLDPTSELASRSKAFVEKSCEWISTRFNITEGLEICDFGCGPGLYTTYFGQKGADVTGIDFSENSIAYAKKVAAREKLNIDYILQNYLHYSTDKRFDLIIMIYCDYCALSDEQRKSLLALFHSLLKDDGFVLLDTYSLKHFENTKEKSQYERSSKTSFWSNFWSSAPYYVFSNTYKYNDKHLILDKYTIIERDKSYEVYNWIKSYSLQSLSEEFAEGRFQIIEHYSDISGSTNTTDSTEIAIIAQKSKV